MDFECSSCHQVMAVSESILSNPDGSLLHVPWTKSHNGLNLFATVCLHCGTVHATSGAPLKFLLTLGNRALTVRGKLAIGEIRNSVELQESLPTIVLSTLKDRGFLTQGDPIPLPANVNLQGWDKQQVMRMLVDAAYELAIYCENENGGEIDETAVMEFVENVKEDDENRFSERTKLASRNMGWALKKGFTPEYFVEMAVFASIDEFGPG